MKKSLFGIVLCLFLGMATFASDDLNETAEVVVSLDELRDLFAEHQSRWVPLALPGDSTLFQNYGLTVPIREKALPKRFSKLLIDYGFGDFPVYQITCTENYITRQGADFCKERQRAGRI